MNDFPLWALLSLAFAVGGMLTLGSAAALFLLELFPPIYRWLDRITGGPDES